ncbi:hypothetical protein ATK30_4797 [Amycolatopsis echigonensis]|uniref:Uncharacterized protein n=1 Tax=Amycolatopsis echigonensis TaxID=2576905 RepID=A0A2N3WJ89_9PSEU|nr:hypothetical protein ATK30_4797 [Amycolatopsis niigatensis]
MVANFSPFVFWLALVVCLGFASPVMAGLAVFAGIVVLVREVKR